MQANLGGSLSDTGKDSSRDPGGGSVMGPGQAQGPGFGVSSGVVAAYTYAARYTYSDVVVQNDNFLRLTAGGDEYQTLVSSSVLTSPASRFATFHDAFGNVTHRTRITSPHQELTLLAIGVVRFESPRDHPQELELGSLNFDPSLDQYLTPTPLVHPDRVAVHAREIVGPSPGLVESVEKITGWVYGNIQYVKASTTVATTAEEVLGTGVGVCQDMAHLAMGMLKGLGIPSRYVCGLLTTEVGETHAWLEFWHPGLGWVPSDPTRGQAVAPHTDLIKFAVGRDYTEAAPVEGTFVSRGSGWLDIAMAQVRFDRDSVTFDDALALIAS